MHIDPISHLMNPENISFKQSLQNYKYTRKSLKRGYYISKSIYIVFTLYLRSYITNCSTAEHAIIF